MVSTTEERSLSNVQVTAKTFEFQQVELEVVGEVWKQGEVL